MNITARRLSRFRHLSTGCLAIGVLGSSLLAAGAAHAASFGHARLASVAGEPFLVLIPVSDLTQADQDTLSARPAPAVEWQAAGLTPPVALDSLQVSVVPSAAGGDRRVLRVSSDRPFVADLADLLLDVSTASGQQRYQVSLVSPAPGKGASAGLGAGSRGASTSSAHAQPPAEAILVKRGDNLFKISRYRVPQGASIYQLMMAFQRVNPRAFIHDNVNLVRAGATLQMPDLAEILSISDAEARRQFMAHVAAFKRLRGSMADSVPSMAAIDRAMASQAQAVEAPASNAPVQPPALSVPETQDRLRLTEPAAPAASADSDHALRSGSAASGASIGPAALAGADAISRPSVLSDTGPVPDAARSHGAVASGQGGAGQMPDSSVAGGVQAAASGHGATNEAAPASGDSANGSAGPGPSAADSSSAAAGIDATRAAEDPDTATAREHALEETKSRISQLEDNIKHLDQALKAQGEAARAAIVQGVESLGSSLGHLADVMGDSSDEPAQQSAPAGPAGVGMPDATGTAAPTEGTGAAGAAMADAADSGASGTPEDVERVQGAASPESVATGSGAAGTPEDVGRAQGVAGPEGVAADSGAAGTPVAGERAQGVAGPEGVAAGSGQRTTAGADEAAGNASEAGVLARETHPAARAAEEVDGGSRVASGAAEAVDGGEASASAVDAGPADARGPADGRLARPDAGDAKTGDARKSAGATDAARSAGAAVTDGSARSAEAGPGHAAAPADATAPASVPQSAEPAGAPGAAGSASTIDSVSGAPGTQAAGSGAVIKLPQPAEGTPKTAAATPQAPASGPESWWQQHVVKLLSGVLVLLVLIFAWVLRKASKAREAAALEASQAQSMVSEKIRDIDLDLK
ncbi:FimV/HubP family polar landmark protein [Castellaniella sp.]|uniref:FimV/HubP family polar landmark protein n=1 Tax=Castellaniella sp. TaxID=1955812 RepID=UPI00355DF1D8